ncbi:MAG: extensin family protein [Hyphomicrobiaceae bacterium]|nr:extensin family protein [Hyphomicrobiaceae bacterium]
MSVLRTLSISSLLVGALALWGCGRTGSASSTSGLGFPRFISKPEPWRRDEESRCLALGLARPSPFLVQRAALGGPGHCGVATPFEMSAALAGRVAMRPAAVLRCEMIPAVDKWVAEVVQPGARRHFGLAVVELKVAASYACRPINHVSGARLSEHGHANALDVSAFQLADGRWISVKGGWWGDLRERSFLRHVHSGGCGIFMTVLGPNYDRAHRDHFHLDLAWHGRDGQKKICK